MTTINERIKQISNYPLPEAKVKESPHADVNIRQAIDGLKRGIERLEAWMDDMDDGFYLPNE